MSSDEQADDPFQPPSLRIPYRYNGLRFAFSDSSRTTLKKRIGRFGSDERFAELIEDAEHLMTIYAYSVAHYRDQDTLNYKIRIVAETYERLAAHVRGMTPHLATRFLLHYDRSNPRGALEDYEDRIKADLAALADARQRTMNTGRLAITKLDRWLVSSLIERWGSGDIRAGKGTLPRQIKDSKDAGRAYVVSAIGLAASDATRTESKKFRKERAALMHLARAPSAKTIQRLITTPDPPPKREPPTGREASGGRRPSMTISQEHLDQFHQSVKDALEKLMSKRRGEDR